MADVTYHEPLGAVLHFPDGRTVKLTGGQHVQVPAGTVVEGGVGGGAPVTLPDAGTVIASGSPGEQQPPLSGTGSSSPGTTARQTAPSTGKQQAWGQTRQAGDLQNAYEGLRAAVVDNLPAQGHQLLTLAHRSIGG